MEGRNNQLAGSGESLRSQEGSSSRETAAGRSGSGVGGSTSEAPVLMAFHSTAYRLSHGRACSCCLCSASQVTPEDPSSGMTSHGAHMEPGCIPSVTCLLLKIHTFILTGCWIFYRSPWSWFSNFALAQNHRTSCTHTHRSSTHHGLCRKQKDGIHAQKQVLHLPPAKGLFSFTYFSFTT